MSAPTPQTDNGSAPGSAGENSNNPAAAAPVADNNTTSAPQETQESIFARNRAIYEASMQQQGASASQSPFQMSNGMGSGAAINGMTNGTAGANFSFDKQSRPRPEDSNGGGMQTPTSNNDAASPGGEEPARKKLIRAGDLAVNQPQYQQQQQAFPPGQQALSYPPPSANNAQSPNNLNTSTTSSNGQLRSSTAGIDTESVMENNAIAFAAKNPGISLDYVKQALRHSRGVFDQNFVTALKLLSQTGFAQSTQQSQSSQLSASGGPAGSPGPFMPGGGAMLPGQMQAPRYPGQTQAPGGAGLGHFPGQATAPQPFAQQAMQMQHQRNGSAGSPVNGPGSANLQQNINGQSAQALANQQQTRKSPQHSGNSQLPQMPKPGSPPQPPPMILAGTHPSIGFSALQVLPQEQHAQFLSLAPQQQVDYSLQVFQSLPPDQRNTYTQQAQQNQKAREQWAAYQQAAAAQAAGTGGARSASNPYIGYASQVPTQQQQMQQQRFPGQNPVFRVGAPNQAGRAPQNMQQMQQQQQAMQQQAMQQQHFQQQQQQQQMHAQQRQPGAPSQYNPQQLAQIHSQQHYFLSQLTPPQRDHFHALPPDQQQQWVWHQIQLRADANRKAQANHSRLRQQQAMSQSVQQAKAGRGQAGNQTQTGPSGQSQPRKPRKRNRYGSDSEDDEQHFTDDSEDDGDEENMHDGSGDEAERELKAVGWFNTCSLDELREMTGISPETAEAVIEMRPYTSPADVRVKHRKRKGVSANLFDNYVELMLSYLETDGCLAACTVIGNDLLEVMNIWTGGRKIVPTESMRPSEEPEDKPNVEVKVEGDVKVEGATSNGSTDANGNIAVPKVEEDTKPMGNTLAVPSAGPSRAGSPGLKSANTASVGANLVELSDDILQQSTAADASEDIKKAFEGYLYRQPALLQEGVKLKNYQMLGVNWLNLLYRKNISCILADEMGLGKTIQVIAFLAHLKAQESVGPHLIVVPSSTLDNWIREFEKFAPALKVFAYYGTQAERGDTRMYLKQQRDLDVIVTTYNMATGLSEDKKFLKKMEFKACVFDEGHQLKNSESKKYKDLMEIKVKWRLLLTGTPLQNNLQELVSLLSFILPKVFSEAQESLRAIFKIPPNAHKNLLTRQRVHAAKSVMTPFVLRRKKAQVLQDLPPKTEVIEYCEMVPRQRDIYRETIEKHKKAVIEYAGEEAAAAAASDKPAKKRGRATQKKGPDQSTTSNVLMSLRKASNHPMLFRKLYDDKKIRQIAKDCLKEEEFADRNVDLIYEDLDLMTDFEIHRFVTPYKIIGKHALKKNEWMDSGKIKKLQEMLPAMKARGDRVLIFSQFVQILDIMAHVLQTMDMKYLTLTGQTNVNDRQGLVDEFTEDTDITCFLLSTRAGGLGLNLAAANVVIILDLDFNPHNDKQAADRAYRMGQTRPVTIYRFIAKGSIEEDILSLAETKLLLDEQVAGESAISGEQAEKLEIEEGEEGVIEKKVKASLMTTLQARFAGDEVEHAKQEAENKPPSLQVTDADADAKSKDDGDEDKDDSDDSGSDDGDD